MTLGRRDFLQRLSAVLAALGVTDSWLAGSVGAYQRALADSSRCLALLIGINDYDAAVWQMPPDVDRGSFLQGALTDVELQRELLINRFNVAPQDILTLVNADATVNQILETAQAHLIDQAQSGDTLVLHFSGLGSQAYLSGRGPEKPLPTLIAVDSRLPDEEVPVVQDLFEESLAQLFNGLRGVKILTVIDASTTVYPQIWQGNFRVRSRPTASTGTWQAPFDHRFKQPGKSWQQLTANWPGILLQPQIAEAIALEGDWADFSAGLFTYALTQQIWTSLPAQRQQWFIHRIDRKLAAWTGSDQSSLLLGKQLSKRPGLPLMSGRLPQPAADGVVSTVDTVNRSATVWLGGLPSLLLPYCDLGLRLQPLPTLPGLVSMPNGTLVITALEGLRAKATIDNLQRLPVGSPVIEIERRLPKEIALTIALDPILERIERVDATSALASMSYIETTVPGERSADCLFGKSSSVLKNAALMAASESDAADTAAAAGSDELPGYELFTPDGSLIAGTTAEVEEAVKTAVTRLTGTLRSLLAVKMLRLTANPVSSRLPVRLLLESQPPSSQLLLVEETLRSRQLSNRDASKLERVAFAALPRDRPEQYQIRLVNSGTTPLYYVLVNVVEKTRLSVYCPPLDMADGDLNSQAIAAASQLPSGSTVNHPQTPNSAFSLQPLQTTEVFVIVTTEALSKTWKAIRTPEFRYQ
ncbi:MAG: caspase family protein, partial [Cyanobacteria bacterium P01_D01_bin.71]